MKNMHFDRTDRMPERTFIIISMTAIALFHIILGVQGFDMCDEGWVLSGFQQIFNDPKSIQYLFLYYLSLNSATLLIVSGHCGQNRPECDFSCSNWLFAIS